MKTILAAVFAVAMSATFVGATFAEDVKSEVPASAPAAGDVKKADAKAEKKHKKHKKASKETAEKKDAVEKK